MKDIKTATNYTHLPIFKKASCQGMAVEDVLAHFDRKQIYVMSDKERDSIDNRYTYIGYQPVLELKEEFSYQDSAKDRIEELLSQYRVPQIEGFPPFTGGLAGYFSYEYMGYIEERLKEQQPTAIPKYHLYLFDKVIVFDHQEEELLVVFHVPVDAAGQETKKALAEIDQLLELLGGETAEAQVFQIKAADFDMTGNLDYYTDIIERGKEYIRAGDIFQVVLSNRFTAPVKGELKGLYKTIRTCNPTAYQFYLGMGDIELIGASPELLAAKEGDKVYTYPLAGTRPRGCSEAEDEALRISLMADEKELAEHNMLVDLARNDIGKIVKFHTVKVEKYQEIKAYPNVMHIESTVSGEIRPECGPMDVIHAVFPAGTLSGAPKIRAMEIIRELEGQPRNFYGGAIGHIGFQGDMKMCIAIRMMYRIEDQAYIQVGAGIVADSQPDKEYQECINKAKAVTNIFEEVTV